MTHRTQDTAQIATASRPLGRRLALCALAVAAAWAAGTDAARAAEDHSAHATAAAAGVRRSEATLLPAAVPVLRQDGTRADFRQALDDGKPVMLNFIFTSCTAICPVTSQVFREVRERLGAQRDAVTVVSISIDPEYDTPRRLTEYAARFSTGGSWNFYTASQKDSVAIQKSFNAYQGDKMNHVPVTFLRAAPGKPWVRVDGFASPRALLAELQSLMATKASTADVGTRVTTIASSH
jgi:protein SCO1